MLGLDLGAEVDDVFASFDRIPLAAASIAQVHAATLDSGERVVVKVRRPGIDTVVAWDLHIVDRLAMRLQRSTRWGRGVGRRDRATRTRSAKDSRQRATPDMITITRCSRRSWPPIVNRPASPADPVGLTW